MLSKLIDLYSSASSWVNVALGSIALLMLRLTVAPVFLNSGLTKWDGFLKFNVEKYDLFLYEFFCPDPVRPGALLLCDSETLDYAEGSSIIGVIEAAAVMAGIMEVVLPILLIVGLFSRFAALGLLGMTIFIQLAVFPTMDHWINPASWWAVTLLAILAMGPGAFSLDRLFKLDGRK